MDTEDRGLFLPEVAGPSCQNSPNSARRWRWRSQASTRPRHRWPRDLADESPREQLPLLRPRTQGCRGRGVHFGDGGDPRPTTTHTLPRHCRCGLRRLVPKRWLCSTVAAVNSGNSPGLHIARRMPRSCRNPVAPCQPTTHRSRETAPPPSTPAVGGPARPSAPRPGVGRRRRRSATVGGRSWRRSRRGGAARLRWPHGRAPPR
mmetsp:Transcript_143102/g.457400  ORF Transcript_143102/g.457400 Transcript_143102/m.457400 type:complete len:204 (+) Transcript_143102:1616-2227(+)